MTQKKIFIVGSAPLPNEKEGVREAAGLRTEQFLSPIQKLKNTEILLIAISNREIKIKNKKTGILEEVDFKTEYFPEKNTRIFWISRHSKNLKSFLKTKISEFSPDVCLGVNTFPAYILSTVLPKNIPFWVDLNGWIMSEGQARGYAEDTNLHLANAFRQERQILSTADKISTVSTAQKFATIGELASMGLLRKENFLEEKVFALPNCTKIFDIDNNKTVGNSHGCSLHEKKLFRKNPEISDNAFVVSWIGGYNNWVDEKTLFNGLEKAMSTVDNLYFVSTGGAIKNIANKTFSRFLERIENSHYKNRFVFLGWIETADMRKIYEESDAGINVDFLCAETELGARNRINEMLKFGLPILTTGGSEISEEVGRYRAGVTIKNGNSEVLAEELVKLSSNKYDLDLFSQNGKKLSSEVYNEDIVQKPVLEFIQNPEKTVLPRLPLESPLFFLKNTLLYLKKNGFKIFWSKVKQRVL